LHIKIHPLCRLHVHTSRLAVLKALLLTHSLYSPKGEKPNGVTATVAAVSGIVERAIPTARHAVCERCFDMSKVIDRNTDRLRGDDLVCGARLPNSTRGICVVLYHPVSVIFLPMVVQDGGVCPGVVFERVGGKVSARRYIEFPSLRRQITVLFQNPGFKDLLDFVGTVQRRDDDPETTYTSRSWRAMMDSFEATEFPGVIRDLFLCVRSSFVAIFNFFCR
jgi:hypothetical protein